MTSTESASQLSTTNAQENILSDRSKTNCPISKQYVSDYILSQPFDSNRPLSTVTLNEELKSKTTDNNILFMNELPSSETKSPVQRASETTSTGQLQPLPTSRKLPVFNRVQRQNSSSMSSSPSNMNQSIERYDNPTDNREQQRSRQIERMISIDAGEEDEQQQEQHPSNLTSDEQQITLRSSPKAFRSNKSGANNTTANQRETHYHRSAQHYRSSGAHSNRNLNKQHSVSSKTSNLNANANQGSTSIGGNGLSVEKESSSDDNIPSSSNSSSDVDELESGSTCISNRGSGLLSSKNFRFRHSEPVVVKSNGILDVATSNSSFPTFSSSQISTINKQDDDKKLPIETIELQPSSLLSSYHRSDNIPPSRSTHNAESTKDQNNNNNYERSSLLREFQCHSLEEKEMPDWHLDGTLKDSGIDTASSSTILNTTTSTEKKYQKFTDLSLAARRLSNGGKLQENIPGVQ
ncbi:unnamed protein product, partial [Didymodactylos carnosus]